jgi:hypothetical protein
MVPRLFIFRGPGYARWVVGNILRSAEFVQRAVLCQNRVIQLAHPAKSGGV